MRIAFVLPGFARAPVGGFKVVYEYANRLSRRGHQVAVVHPRRCGEEKGTRWDYVAWSLRNRVVDGGRPPWFPVDRGVEMRFVPDLSFERLPEGDALVATAWQTAKPVARSTAGSNRGFYLIQGHERWSGDPAEVDATWHLPLRKVVISRWLQEIAEELGEGERTVRIPNGIDLATFRVERPLGTRAARVGMLHHEATWKGTSDGIRALESARADLPHLSAVLFGTAHRPADLPEWIEYVRKPATSELVALYNSCAVYLQPSWTEGWGLTATEAMACGCALVTTDNGGSRDYAFDGETALVAPARDAQQLSTALLRVCRDQALRTRLAEAGHRHVQQYRWSDAVDRLEAHLGEGR